jgi:hypothetical protein
VAEVREGAAPGPEPLRMLTPVAATRQGERPWESAGELPEGSAAAVARAHSTLFAPERERELLIALAGATRRDGDVEADAVAETVANGHPIVSLPRLPRRVLTRHVQVLTDLSPGMEPFSYDRSLVVAQLRKAVGDARVTVLQFRSLPLSAAGPGPVWTWKPYVPPPEDTTVLAVTDLAVGTPDRSKALEAEREWRQLAAIVRRRSSRLVALVPYRPSRLPGRLRDELAIVTWDRPTGIVDVAAALDLARI